MSFDTSRRYAATEFDAPQPARSDHTDEAELLERIKAELETLGGQATIRCTGSGSPFLSAVGVSARFNEEITTTRRNGQVRAMWNWGEELPAEPSEAAAALHRVTNPGT